MKIVRFGSIGAIALIVLFVTVALIAYPLDATGRPPLGVTNLDSLHLKDTNGTATPNLLADQRGSGAIAEFRDGGTPVARFPNGGGFNLISGPLIYGVQTSSVTATFVITPTAQYIVMSSTSAFTSSTTTPIITTTATSGQVVILHNSNASDALIVDGTGGTIECGANVSLGADDMLTLIYNATDLVWHCQAYRDNSP